MFLLRTKHVTYHQYFLTNSSQFFCNNTTQNIMSSHSLHYAVSTSLLVDKWHPFKLVISIDNLAEYEKQYSPKWDAMTSSTSRPQHHKISLKHCPDAHFSAFSLVTRFSHDLSFCIFIGPKVLHSIYHINYTALLISHASWWHENHSVYWLNTAQFCCK